MSDGFDKEAEREKLREKFADDDEKREHTQRMSELLLKGATMTNRHCDDCGDPIFRQDGQEFCPTCHTVDAADTQEAAQATRTTTETQNPNAPNSEATPAEDAPATNREEPTVTSRNAPSSDSRSTETRASAPPEMADHGSTSESTDTARTDAQRDGTAGASEPRTHPTASDEAGSVADARESLTRTLTRFARAAEQTDDPRRAREHLRAAREAAEALAALDR